MNQVSINIIGDKCCGCGVCQAVCPKKSVYSHSGVRDQLLYTADDTCIRCGKCLKTCPAYNSEFYGEVSFFYKAYSKNKEVLKKSSSGGIAYEMGKWMIENGGMVIAAVWNIEKQAVIHGKIVSIEELRKMQGSKYIHSVIEKELYRDVANIVKSQKVLFIGTPCQVSAVRNLTGNSENLICIDLVCHGVPSPELWKKQLKKLKLSAIESVSFRRGTEFILDLKDSNGKVYSEGGYDNPYYSLFLNFASLRESCYSCTYAQRKRVGDLTIGDYEEEGKGFSCVLVNSDIGELLIKETEQSINYENRDTYLLEKNVALNHPTPKTKNVEIFTKLYNNKRRLYFSYYRTFYTLMIKRTLRKMLGDKLYDKIIASLKN